MKQTSVEVLPARRATALVTTLVALVVSGQFGPALAAGSAPQETVHAIKVSASKEQLTMVMFIPGGSYSRGATVPVRLRLHNSSSRVRVLWVWNCHNPPYGIQVLNRNGKVVYPPATRSRGGLPCTGNLAPVLFPGKSITYHVSVVLNGPLIRARIPFGMAKGSEDTQEILSTKAILVGNF